MPIQEQKLSAILSGGKQIRDKIRTFLNDNRLPFLATDRNVLNLPGIGKSMTFRIAGITKEGKRILRFEHDSNRRHSPVTEKMGSIYIVENKSVGAYLRQLEMLGENPKDYESIWSYGNGQTEPRFSFFEYPRFDFNLSQELSHFRSTDFPV
jgi:lysine 2,3-aminomutase